MYLGIQDDDILSTRPVANVRRCGSSKLLSRQDEVQGRQTAQSQIPPRQRE